VATVAGIWSANIILDRQVDLKELEATRFPFARQLAPFTLVDHNNEVFNETTLRERWSFLFFGYTHCPDVCPVTLSVLNSVAQRLQDVDADIRFVFVSVDPQRDTPEKLAQFVRYFNKNFIGVTGSGQQIEDFTRELGLLFDPDGRYHAVFSPPLSAGKISDDFRKILKAYR